MKDVTSTTFGLLIAFLLPGIVFLLALSYWITPFQDVFNTFNSAQSNVGLFLLVVLISIALSLQISIFRWAIFERIICCKTRLLPEDFRGLAQESKLMAFRAAVDEHYRYHQFWGAMAIIIPFFILGWGLHEISPSSLNEQIIFWISALIVELLTVLAAGQAYILYVNRSKKILTEGTMPNGWEKDKDEEASKIERFRETEKPRKPDPRREPTPPSRPSPPSKPPREKPKKED